MIEKRETIWASASPVILIGTAFLLFTITPALILPPKGPEGSLTMFAWSMGAVLAIVIGSIIEFKRGQLLLATTGVVFGIILGVPFTVSSFLKSWWVITGMTGVQPNGAFVVEGFTWLAAFIVLTGLLYAYGCLSGALFLFVSLVDVAFLLLSLFSFGVIGPIVVPIAGWIIFIFGIFNALSGIVFFINEFAEKPVFSLGKPLFKP